MSDLGLNIYKNLMDYWSSCCKRLTTFENRYLDNEKNPPKWTDIRMFELLEKTTNKGVRL